MTFLTPFVKKYKFVVYKTKAKGILAMMMEIYGIVTGKVQGVAYRYYIQDAANELDVTGWIRNLEDGTVEVVAQGATDTLKEFVEYLNEGSLLAKVEGVDIEWREAKKQYDDFSILH